MAAPPFSADEPNRNLLFGILALQNNFIDRDALLAAFAAWVVDKQRPLGEILCKQGKLTPSQEELLRALAAEHLKQHGNDPAQSLAAVSTVGSLPDELLKLGDPQLEATLSLVGQTRPKDAAHSGAAGESHGSGQRFRILRPHAQGGLGEVSVAHDVELNREVALKEIRSQFSDDTASRSRFVLEAEITGGLEHPGIVPVYGLGQYADGRPYYAMRFIRGDSLKEAIAQFHAAPRAKSAAAFASVEFRKLLGRFIDVCQAIEYAHSRGVLHRDLKPGNIMLGKYGETLVVDWGLAKAAGKSDQFTTADEATLVPSSGSAVERTVMGAVIGTPAYMSPEQGSGRLDQLGPSTDVYSLGATLYHVLTGQPPMVASSLGELLVRVQRGEFPRPTQYNPQIPKALEAVCLKAMALRPEDRFPKAAEIGDDVERWLADEPVTCLAEPLVVRARRWVKRHPALVVGTAATVLISLVSLAAIAAIIGQSNRSLAAKNGELDAKNTALELANQRERDATALAQKNERTSDENAKVAREQSQLALKSLQSVIFDIQRKLDNVPGAGDLQRSLLQTALARLQEVSDQFASRSAIDRSTMVALHDLGDVFLRIGTSSPRPGTPGRGAGGEGSADAVGPLAAARKVYQQAFDIAQKLAAADPSDAQAQRDLSFSYNKLGDVQLQSGQVTEARGSYQQGLEIRQKLAAADPSDELALCDLVTSYSNLGNVQLQSGQVTEALGSYQKMHDIAQKLAAADPSDAQAQRDLSVSYSKLGDAQLQSGQVTEALGSYQQLLEIIQKLAAADPSDAQAQRDLSVSYSKLGDVQLQSGQVTEALGSYQQLLEIIQKLAAADPSDARAQRDLSVSYDNLGDVLSQSGQMTEARGSYQQGLEIRQKLAAADPSDARAQRDLSISYNKLGNVQIRSGQVTEALGSYQQGLEISQKLAAADPSDAQSQNDLSISLEKLGDVSLQSGKLVDAREYFGRKLAIDQKLIGLDRQNAKFQRDLSISYNKLGDVQLQSGQVTEALGFYQQGLEISQKLAAADPSDAQAQYDLYVSLAKTGEPNRKAKRFESAISSYEKALQVLQNLDRVKPLSPHQRAQIGVMQRRIQQCQHSAMALGDWKNLLEQPAEVLPVMLEMRGVQFVQEGRAVDAVQAIAKLRELGTATPDQLYNAACVYCMCTAATKGEKDELTAEQATERKKHIADALETLREAIKAGYKDFAHMQQDPDLKLLRDLPDFQALLPK